MLSQAAERTRDRLEASGTRPDFRIRCLPVLAVRWTLLGSLPLALACGGLIDMGPEGLGHDGPDVGDHAPSGPLHWTRQFGSAGQDKASAVVFTPFGSVVLAGWTAPGAEDTPDTIGKTDSFVRRYDAAGGLEWATQFGTTESDGVYSALSDGEDIVLSGYCSGAMPDQQNLGAGDAYLARVSAEGTLAWVRQFGTTGHDVAYGVARAPSGALLVVGYVSDALPGEVSAGREDAFYAEFDGGGQLAKVAQFGSLGQDVAYAVCTHADGGFTVVGGTDGALGVDPAQGKEDAFFRRYDAAGALVTSRQFGGPSRDVATSVACPKDGTIVVGGYSYSSADDRSYDGFVHRYDREGSLVVSRVIGAGGSDYVFALATDERGSIYVAGATEGTLTAAAPNGRSDSFIVTLDAALSEQSVWQFGSSEFGEARAVSTGTGGRWAAAGYSSGPLPGQHSQGSVDAYVTVLD